MLTNPNPEEARLRHFLALDPQQQIEAMHRLAAAGWSEHAIAHATRLAVEMVKRVLQPG